MAQMRNLKSFADRIDRLDEEIKTVNGDKKEVYAEARGSGFDVAVLKAAVKRRRQLETEPGKVEEHDALLEIYLAAITERATEPKGGPGVSSDHPTTESPVAVTETPANGNVPETASYVRVHEGFDPETGELTEEIPAFLDRRPKLVAAE